MLHRYLKDQNDDLRLRYDERSLADEATWANAPLKAKRSKVFLAFPRRLLSKTVDKAVAISGSFLPTKVVLRPTARGDDSPLLRFKSKTADSDSLTTQQSFETGRDSMQEVELSKSSTPGIDDREVMDYYLRMLKETLEKCGRTLKKLSEEALRWSKLTHYAEFYFESIARDVEAELARLDLWATNEDEAQDLRVGDKSSNKTLKDAIGALEGILSAAENIQKQMDILGSLASQDSVQQTGCETEFVNLLPAQESFKMSGEHRKTSHSLAGQEEVAYKFAELLVPSHSTIGCQADCTSQSVRRLYTLSSRIEQEFKCISLHVAFLERMTDEVHEPRATQDQKEPLLAHRQESPRIRSQPQEVRADAQESQAEIDRGAPRRQMPTARGACTTWYDSHEEGEEEKEESEEGEEEEKMEEEDEEGDEEEDSNYDDDDDEDDDARFNEWKMNGYMRTPNVFYSWQERVQPHFRDSVMQICIDPKSP